MRLPWISLQELSGVLVDRQFALLGCLSFEPRCTRVPTALWLPDLPCHSLRVIQINDPDDAEPNFAAEIQPRVAENRLALDQAGVVYQETTMELLASEDELIDAYVEWRSSASVASVVLDITSFPKRYFCLLTKLLLKAPDVQDVFVTYTRPGAYSGHHLAEDPMSSDHLPGFAPPPPSPKSLIVIGIGFESLSMRPMLEAFGERKRDTKIILAAPLDISAMKREWDTVKRLLHGDARTLSRENIKMVATWDAEDVYQTVARWSADADGVTLAPFGPKPHSLGFALFAISKDAGLIYTQPKSYNPDYSIGYRETWVYVAKWQGIPCYSREQAKV